MRRYLLALLLGCLLLVAGASALDGYDYYQMIEYAACDQEIYQQDIVIHRSTGTAYNETAGGLETWHIYAGDHCQADYDDIRFTNSTGELAYYLWPDYTSSSARFAVRLEGADAAGEVTVWYGNEAATTTSDGGATFPLLFYDFEDKSLDGWTPLGGTWSAQNQNLESSSINTYIATTNEIDQTELVWECDVKVVNNAVVQVYVLAHQAASYQNQWNVAVEPAGASFWYGDSRRVAANQALPAGEMAHITLSRSPSGVWKLWQNGVYVGTATSTIAPGRYVKVRTHWATPATYAWDNLLVRAYSAAPPAALTFNGEQETAAPPVTTFTASPTAGLAPLTVQFTDISAGTPTSWLWNFGDGGTSTTQNPQHTYAAPGTYSVNLTATNEYGSDYELKTDYITVYSPITAQFTANVTGGTAPVSVQFTDLSTGGPTAWSWTFGDGNTSTDQNPAHTYTTAGTHTVTLAASHPYDSDTETKTSYITVAVLQPFPGLALTPTDPAGTGLYTDINGNNRLDYNDLTVFFLNLAWARDNEPTECFDFNANSRLDYADVISLFQVIKNA
ncbi:MAG: DUF2341 domain-containing protein [Bacteroidales bacterium]|jgi:PKD repeat protein